MFISTNGDNSKPSAGTGTLWFYRTKKMLTLRESNNGIAIAKSRIDGCSSMKRNRGLFVLVERLESPDCCSSDCKGL
jgi:hypothetical protein